MESYGPRGRGFGGINQSPFLHNFELYEVGAILSTEVPGGVEWPKTAENDTPTVCISLDHLKIQERCKYYRLL